MVRSDEACVARWLLLSPGLVLASAEPKCVGYRLCQRVHQSRTPLALRCERDDPFHFRLCLCMHSPTVFFYLPKGCSSDCLLSRRVHNFGVEKLAEKADVVGVQASLVSHTFLDRKWGDPLESSSALTESARGQDDDGRTKQILHSTDNRAGNTFSCQE